MNKILAALAVIPLTPLMHWVGGGVIMFAISVASEGKIEGAWLTIVPFVFYVLFLTLFVYKNILYHSAIWILAFGWNFYLLKNEILGQFGDDDWFWIFRYAAVWIIVLSISFFLLQAFRVARSESFIQKYRIALDQFRSLGRNHRP